MKSAHWGLNLVFRDVPGKMGRVPTPASDGSIGPKFEGCSDAGPYGLTALHTRYSYLIRRIPSKAFDKAAVGRLDGFRQSDMLSVSVAFRLWVRLRVWS
jgi:hypothetical protein